MYRFEAKRLASLLLVAAVWHIGGCSATGKQSLASSASPIEVSPANKISKPAHPGETITAAFKLKNTSNESIKLLGAHTTCGCTVAEGLPLTLEPGASGEVRLLMTVEQPKQGDRIAQSAILFVNRDVVVPQLTVEAVVSQVQ